MNRIKLLLAAACLGAAGYLCGAFGGSSVFLLALAAAAAAKLLERLPPDKLALLAGCVGLLFLLCFPLRSRSLKIAVVALVLVLALLGRTWLERRPAAPTADYVPAVPFADELLWTAAVLLVFFGAAHLLASYTSMSGVLRAVCASAAALCVGIPGWRRLTSPRAAGAAAMADASGFTKPSPVPRMDAFAAAQPSGTTEPPRAEPPQPEVSLDPDTLAGVCRAVAMGYLFIYFNINLGTLDILPDWMGYLFMVNQLGILAGWEPAALLLRPLGLLLAGFNGLEWVCTLLGVSIDTWPILPLVVQVVNLYFHFQLLTNLADAVRHYLPDEADGIVKLRTMNTLFLTLLALPLPWQSWQYAALALMLLSLVVTLALWWKLRVVRYALQQLA